MRPIGTSREGVPAAMRRMPIRDLLDGSARGWLDVRARGLGGRFGKVPLGLSVESQRGPRTRSLLRLIVGGTVGFASLTALVCRGDVEAVDRAIAVRVQSIHHPLVERGMAFVSWFGFPPQSRVLPAVYATVLWIAHHRLEAVFQLAAWGTALLSTLLKSFMRRPRPVAGKDLRVVAAPLGGSSMPSGHVLTYVGVYGWMAIMADHLIRPLVVRRLVVAALASLIAAIGPSRVHLGHHWPTDVAASYLLGASYLGVLVLFYRRFSSRGVLG